MHPLFRALVVLLSVQSVIACTEKKETVKLVTNNDFAQFQDVADTSEQIQEASKAVVKIETADGSLGTGFFVNSTGIMATNDHVLGSKNCLKEGCDVTIVTHFQKKALSGTTPRAEKKVLYAEPVHVDTGADVNFYQLSEKNWNDQGVFKITNLQTPNYLKIAESLRLGEFQKENKDFFVVGHPLGMLKKVLTVKITNKHGILLQVDKAMLPGNSGSPILNSDMEVVGIGHTSLISSYEMAKNGVQGFSMGSSVERFPLIQGLSVEAGISGVGLERFKSEKSLNWKRASDVLLAMSRQSFPSHFPRKRAILDEHWGICLSKINTSDINTYSVTESYLSDESCQVVTGMTECLVNSQGRDGTSSLVDDDEETNYGVKVCPLNASRKKMLNKIFEKVKNRIVAKNYFDVPVTIQILSKFTRQIRQLNLLMQSLFDDFKAYMVADFYTIDTIHDDTVKLSLIQSLGVQTERALILNYASFPFYKDQSPSLLSMAIKQVNSQNLSQAEFQQLWGALKTDPKINIRNLWAMEVMEFNSSN